MPAASRLLLENLTFRHPGADSACVAEVSGEVRSGEWVCIVGANGVGKSTLLRLAAGLLRPASGRAGVDLCGRSFAPGERGFRRAVSYLAQSPHEQVLGLKVGDELAAGLEWHGVPPAEICARVGAALGRLGPFGQADRLTGELSQGERHRLALEAAVLPGPAFLLVDEPLSGLDPFARAAWLSEMAELRARGVGVLTTSTSAAEASHADRVWLLRRGQPGAHGCEPGDLARRGAAREAGLREIPDPEELRRPSQGPDRGAPLVQVRAGRLERGARTLWGSLDLDVQAAGLTALWAPNGTGKTSLAMALAGLLPWSAGRVEGALGWSGEGARRVCHSALAFQGPEDQLTGATVRQELEGDGRARRPGWAEEAARRLGLSAEVLDRPPLALSAGERRRVALGALESLSPTFLVLDEPLSGLDGPGARGVSAWLAEQARTRGVWAFSCDVDAPEIPVGCWRALSRESGLSPLQAGARNLDSTYYFPWAYWFLSGPNAGAG